MADSDYPVLERARVRELDRVAIEELGLPGVVLMENAGRGAAEALRRELPEHLEQVVVLCGAGNNGGDGYVVARHLFETGSRVVVLETAAPEALAPDAAVFRRVAVALGIETHLVGEPEALEACCALLQGPTLFVDALLGTGFQGRLRSGAAALLTVCGDWVRRWGTPVAALDAPSGLDVDTGEVDPACLPADLTLTFAALKPALAGPRPSAQAGRVVLVGIGAPRVAYERVM